MTTMLLLLLSGVLIGTGVSLIWRDVHNKRRDAFVLSRDPEGRTGVGARCRDHGLASCGVRSALRPLRPRCRHRGATLSSQLLKIARGSVRRCRCGPQRRTAAAPRRGTPIGNRAAVGGAAARDQHGGGAGECRPYRRRRGHRHAGRAVVEREQGLRLGSAHPGRRTKPGLAAPGVHGGRQALATVKAHEDGLAEINSDASAPAAGLSIGRVSDLLSECLKPAAAYAVRTKGDVEQMASETAWKEIEAVVIAALKAGNGALSQAGVRLLPLAPPAWDADLRHHRMPVAVQVFGNDIARMHIDRLDQEIEVAVGLPDAHLARSRPPRAHSVEGMTMHTLAELIASCAWPAIARLPGSARAGVGSAHHSR